MSWRYGPIRSWGDRRRSSDGGDAGEGAAAREALDLVWSRVAAAVHGPDPRAVLTPRLAPDVAELARRRNEIGIEHQADLLQLLGCFHASRYFELPDGEDDDDFEHACRWFTELGNTRPDMVPDGFRDLLEDDGGIDGLLLEWRTATAKADRTGREDHLRAAATIGRRLVACVVADPDEATLVALCASGSLSALADGTGDEAAEHDAVDAAREAQRRCPPSGEHRLDVLVRLGTALLSRIQRKDSPGDPDLDELITVAHELLAACGPEDEQYALVAHGELGECYRMRGSVTESTKDLEASMRHHRAALDLCDPHDEDHPMYVLNLASALVNRATSSGSIRHLEEAVALADPLRRARLTSEGTFLRHQTLANAFRELALATEDTGFTERCLEHHRAAVRVRGLDEAHALRARLALGNALTAAFHSALPDDVEIDGPTPLPRTLADAVPSRARALLDEGIAVQSDIARDRRTPGPMRRVAEGSLAQSLHTRYLLDGRRADLEEASRRAEQAAGDGSETDALVEQMALAALAHCLRSRYVLDADRATAQRACRCWRRVVEDLGADLDTRLLSALLWGETALTANLAPHEAVHAFETAVRLLGDTARPGSRRADVERRLARWRDVASDAAVAAIRAGREERALELLEQGRGVLWNALLASRADLHEVERSRPDLAAAVADRRAEIVALNVGHPGAGSEQAEALLVAGRRLDEAVGAVRAAGFPEFGQPASTSRLVEHAWRGTIAIVSASTHGSHALLVSRTGVDVVELPGLDHSVAVTWAGRYLEALGRRRPDEAVLAACHEWLWHAVARPVLDRIGATGAGEDLPRLWWCPTGPLSLLPLHAAGVGEDTVLDRAVSSYTATVRSLSRSGRGDPAASLGRGERALFIGMNETPGEAPLQGVARERASLDDVLGPGRVVAIEDRAATLRTVRQAWTFFSVVHFSGHGAQLAEAPSRGGLLVHDGILTVADLADLPVEAGSLAVLSACDTAAGGVVNLDEAISVAGALQYGGWETVVGTLWPVIDGVAADMSEMLHEALFGDAPLPPHRAMHDAVRRQRDLHPDRPSVWAPFVHVGV